MQLSAPFRRKSRAAARQGVAASVEALEQRRLLATYYVDGIGGDGLAEGGHDLNNGTSIDTPFRSIQHALNVVLPGDTIYIRGGIYREKLIVRQGHFGSPGNYVTIRNYADEVPDIRGSQQVTGWEVHGTNSYGVIWKKTNWTSNSQQVFDNGVPLQQIGLTGYPYASYQITPKGTGLASMSPGRFFMDTSASTLYVQLADGSDPNDSVMEASTGINGVDYGRTFMAERDRGWLHLIGLTFRHSNTSALAEQGAMVNLSSNSIAENCTFMYADFCGVNLGYLTDNVKVINCTIINNGDSGINVAGVTNFLISGNTITGNNYRQFSGFWHAGGIKLASNSSIGAFPHGIIENNVVAHNTGPGIWFDYCYGPAKSIIRGNYVHDNTTEGIFHEYSANAEIYNNVVVDNSLRQIYLTKSHDVNIYNNTVVTRSRGSMGIAVDRRNPGEVSYNVEVRNNLFSASRSWTALYIWGAEGAYNITSDYNHFHSSWGNAVQRFALHLTGKSYTFDNFSAWQDNGTFVDSSSQQVFGPFDDHSTTGDPKFIVGSGDDFRLAPDSPAVDAGYAVSGVTTDYAGNPRPAGQGFDIGAYELSGDLTPPTVVIEPVPSELGIDSITITFDEPVEGFDVSDLVLTRDGGANLLTGDEVLTTSDNVSYTLSNLAALTAIAGAYELRLLAGGSGIVDMVGNALVTGASQSWLAASVVAERLIFYNRSYFDGNNPAANAADDGAIATDKWALLPGQEASFANYTSYSRGINGIMVDIKGLPGAPSVDDFIFRVGNSNDPAAWSAAPAPQVVSVRPGAGVDGSDRVTITWADNAIAKQWLQITVKSNANTGLASPDVFYFGNAIGDTGNSAANAFVDGNDLIGVRDNPHNFLNRAAVDDVYDINRDSLVDGTDLILTRDNATNFLTALKLISVPGELAQSVQQPLFVQRIEDGLPMDARREKSSVLGLRPANLLA